MRFVEDLFKGLSNKHWDLARFAGMWAVLTFSFTFIHAEFWLHKDVNWLELGGGYAALLGGAAAFIAGKDISKAKADAITQGADNA